MLCSARVGGHLPGEATAVLLSDPDFQPHTHSMVFFVLFCFLLSGVLFWRGFLFGWFFWIISHHRPTLFFHLFPLVLFWMSMPFSVLD